MTNHLFNYISEPYDIYISLQKEKLQLHILKEYGITKVLNFTVFDVDFVCFKLKTKNCVS